MIARQIILTCTIVVASCASPYRKTDYIDVEGTVQQLAGTQDCYLIEVGKKINEKAFYQLLDTPERLASISGHLVTIRIRVDSAATGPCPVGTPAHVLHVISSRPAAGK